MPYSYDAFDYYISTVIGLLRPATVCDIGPGAGKYAKIVGDKAAEDGFTCHMTAIEIDESYVSKFDLRSKYNDLIVGDAVDIIKTPRIRFDLVIIGDCIEHMRKSDGLDLVNFLIYRTGYICIVYPEALVQDDWEGHAAEAHLSVWGADDFRNMNVIHRSWSSMHLFLIKGYQPSRMTITA